MDVGWPGGMQDLKWSFASEGLSVKEVTHVLVTHYHIDHGAIAQEMKDKGAKLIVLESQREYLNLQKMLVQRTSIFHEINPNDNVDLTFRESRVFLKTLSINGEIIATTGHSPDHVTLVLDEGIAFTGDLPSENASPEGSVAFENWQRLRSMNVRKIYPAHGQPYDLIT